MALSGYIVEWDEVGPRLHAAPSDTYIEIALGTNVMVLAEMLKLLCHYFGIERPDVFEEIEALIASRDGAAP